MLMTTFACPPPPITNIGLIPMSGTQRLPQERRELLYFCAAYLCNLSNAIAQFIALLYVVLRESNHRIDVCVTWESREPCFIAVSQQLRQTVHLVRMRPQKDTWG